MALVAYDDSGSEDNEETEDYNRPAVVSKTEKPTVKIGLPFNNLSADSDDSDDETVAPVIRRPKPAGAKSGLASFLPEPKAGKGKSVVLVPPNVQSRIQAARNATKHKKANLSSFPQQPTNDKEEPDEGTESFFSYLDSKPAEEQLSTVRVGPSMPQTNTQSNLYHFEGSSDVTDVKQVAEDVHSGQQQIANSVEDRLSVGSVNSSSRLDPEALKKLAGKKRRREDINIVDVNEGDVVQQMDQERLKKASEETAYKGSGRGRGRGGVSGLHKKKHQITYLIHEAKEKELELKQQWAANKSNRRESRLKYGF